MGKSACISQANKSGLSLWVIRACIDLWFIQLVFESNGVGGLGLVRVDGSRAGSTAAAAADRVSGGWGGGSFRGPTN